MGSIHGHRPPNSGREAGLDSATSLLKSVIEDGKLCCFILIFSIKHVVVVMDVFQSLSTWLLMYQGRSLVRLLARLVDMAHFVSL